MAGLRVGVLALQGDFREHVAAFDRAGVDATTVRTAAELDAVDALSIPGGESTTLSRLVRVFGLEEPLRTRLAEGMPCLGTCAGMILLSRRILDGRDDQISLGAIDIDVRRNGYGRQVESFEAPLDIAGIDGGPLRGVFIRAPVIERVGRGVTVLSELDGKAVAVAQGSNVALAFHPEMTPDTRVFEAFAAQAQAATAAA